jgi:hypothetical protein
MRASGPFSKHLRQDASFLLGVVVFAGKHVAQQHPVGLQNHQGQPRQRTAPNRPQFFDAVFGGRQVIPVDDLHPVAPQQGTAALSEGVAASLAKTAQSNQPHCRFVAAPARRSSIWRSRAKSRVAGC